MRNYLAIAIILLMAMLNLAPPLFTEGGFFDATAMVKNECGKLKLVHGIYADNAYYTISSLLLSYLGLVLPILKPSLNKYWKSISFILGCWFLFGLLYEVMNWFVPTEVLNSMFDRSGFNRYLIVFILSLSTIFIHAQWTRLKKNY